MAKKITELPNITTLASNDVFPVVDITAGDAGTSKITLANLVKEIQGEYNRWKSITNFTAAPGFNEFDGTNFNSISDWAVSTGYSLGDCVKPISLSGVNYFYECVSAGTSGPTEPSWGTTLGADTTESVSGGPIWRCRGIHVISTTSDLSNYIKVGMPIKFVQDSVAYYAIIIGINSSKIAIVGAPIKASYNITSLYYGDPEMVIQKEFHIANHYDNGVDTELLKNDENKFFRWEKGDAYCISFNIIHKTDAASTQGKINVLIETNIISVNDTNKGILASTSWTDNSYVAINTINYKIEKNDDLEINCTLAGTGSSTASDLTVIVLFVLE